MVPPALCQPPNKQLERTVIRRRVRAASAPLHFALAARWTAQRAAAQLRRYTLLRAPNSHRSIRHSRGARNAGL
jgi:hypothetical protein